MGQHNKLSIYEKYNVTFNCASWTDASRAFKGRTCRTRPCTNILLPIVSAHNTPENWQIHFDWHIRLSCYRVHTTEAYRLLILNECKLRGGAGVGYIILSCSFILSCCPCEILSKRQLLLWVPLPEWLLIVYTALVFCWLVVRQTTVPRVCSSVWGFAVCLGPTVGLRGWMHMIEEEQAE